MLGYDPQTSGATIFGVRLFVKREGGFHKYDFMFNFSEKAIYKKLIEDSFLKYFPYPSEVNKTHSL
jgi:hypothetical protein